jgi:hypothetical protein
MANELTTPQKERIRKMVKKELNPEQTKRLRDSFTEDQANQVRAQIWKASFLGSRPDDLRGAALVLVGIMVGMAMYFGLT